MSMSLTALAPRTYRVIAADPPWDFRAGKKGRPQHYARMSVADICAMPVRDLVHPDGGRLLLWTTFPMLPRAFQVMSAWGFRHSTGRVWAKLWPTEDEMFIYPDSLARGTGYEVIGNCEILMIGKRGRPQPIKGKKPASLFFARRREHSRKPDCFMDEVTRLFDGPRLEMFARERRAGWDAFGNQVEKFAEAAE
ncbi:MT-A70 family methyltransferase [Xanthobacter sp. VTT E-85241]|uniref:MT-A70 family methyltransferase n=1 Tax=Roseixanthobacter finlandensis TaxID=3119922 RepID=UPI00372CA26A